MDELVPKTQEPLNICAVLIKEECEESLETPEEAEHGVFIKIERNYEDKSYNADNTPALSDSASTFTCDICTKQFLQKRYLTAHQQRHPEYKELAIKHREEMLRLKKEKKDECLNCTYCGKEFSTRSIFNRHMKIHTGEKPSKNLKCDICEKAFAYKRDLRVHLRVHTGEKPFKCKICGQQFSQLSSLQYHEQGHLDKKPFPCDLCEKQFIRRISLVRHKQVHSGHRPFECHLCEKAFTQKRHLKNHQQIHTKHKCRKGSKTYVHKGSYAINT